MNFNSNELATALGACADGDSIPFTGYSIDTRTIREGDLFFPLEGPNHDGHAYIPTALQKGAGAVARLSHRGRYAIPEGKAVLWVEDPLAALQRTGALVRDILRPKVVAITGSVGKTTTKDLTAAILSTRYRVMKTTGNMNNTIGMPLELARMPASTEVAVLEMGMSFPGEIRFLTKIARPDIATITAVAPVHLMNFESLEGIMEAKGEILEGLAPSGTFVAHSRDERVLQIAARFAGTVRRYAVDRDDEADSLDAWARDLRVHDTSSEFRLHLNGADAAVTLPLPGFHNVANFLNAALISSSLGLSAEEIATAATTVKPAHHRGEIRGLSSGILLYDDCYNSSPKALSAAFEAFEGVAGSRRRVAIIGEMRELGPRSPVFHAEAGRNLASRVQKLLCVQGDAASIAEAAKKAGMASSDVAFAATVEDAAAMMASILEPGDALFVKGSRGVQLDMLVPVLESLAEGRGLG